MRKAQGISMDVIVVAAFALLILVILAIIFMGRTDKDWSSCFEENNLDYEPCIDKCFGEPCREAGLVAWNEYMIEHPCDEWNDNFGFEPIRVACEETADNNECEFWMNGDITIKWVALNRTERYSCTHHADSMDEWGD